jgi:hypothetical protein
MDVCYNVQATIDSKHNLIVDIEATNDTDDHFQLAKMSKQAKDILGVDKLEVLADKGYYNEDEIKDCVDNGMTPYVPQPEDKVFKSGVPAPEFAASKFKYDKDSDTYICPCLKTLKFSHKSDFKGRVLGVYKTKECLSCICKSKCTKSKAGRVIYRWEHAEILQEMRDRVLKERLKVKKRQQMCEHPFGTLKRGFDQGYTLLKGLVKVNGEVALSGLVYNIRRVINVLGVRKMISAIG